MVTEDTDDCLLRPASFCPAWYSCVVGGAGVVSEIMETVEDLNPDESMLSSVLLLVVDPPVSLGK
jgi:hypothetical protein